jgi:hypothetical protein
MNDQEKETVMNYWLAEELTRLACAERQRELDAYRLQHDFSVLRTNWTFTDRAALKLGDWLIATGESLRRRYDKSASISPWVDIRKFAR